MSLEHQDAPAGADLPRCPRCKRLISTPCVSRVNGDVKICQDCDNLEDLHLHLWPDEPLPPVDVCLLCGNH